MINGSPVTEIIDYPSDTKCEKGREELVLTYKPMVRQSATFEETESIDDFGYEMFSNVNVDIASAVCHNTTNSNTF